MAMHEGPDGPAERLPETRYQPLGKWEPAPSAVPPLRSSLGLGLLVGAEPGLGNDSQSGRRGRSPSISTGHALRRRRSMARQITPRPTRTPGESDCTRSTVCVVYARKDAARQTVDRWTRSTRTSGRSAPSPIASGAEVSG